jgi:hypothetical protein
LLCRAHTFYTCLYPRSIRPIATRRACARAGALSSLVRVLRMRGTDVPSSRHCHTTEQSLPEGRYPARGHKVPPQHCNRVLQHARFAHMSAHLLPKPEMYDVPPQIDGRAVTSDNIIPLLIGSDIPGVPPSLVLPSRIAAPQPYIMHNAASTVHM